MSKQQLIYIQQLIKQKQYDEARERLVRLSNAGNPTAQKWLIKLDQIAPPSTPARKPARKKAPPKKSSQKQSGKFDYSTNRLEAIEEQKEANRAVRQREQNTRRGIGCALRGCSTMLLVGIILFLMLPMLLAAGITSGNPQAQEATARVFSFVEAQQANPVGRAVTTMYTQTSGRAMKTVVEPRSDEICNIAIEQAAANGRNVTRAECERTLSEAMACVTDEFDEAEQCLRNYMMSRCMAQAGNRNYCENFVRQYMP